MKKYIAILAMILVVACESVKTEPSIDQIVEDYVKLVLEIGQYSDYFVDAYFGPEEWKPTKPKLDSFPKDDFVNCSNSLLAQCDSLLNSEDPKLEASRIEMLKKQLIAVRTKVEMLGGKTYTFDEEAKLLFDAAPPHYPYAHFDELLKGLDTLLEGDGDLQTRYHNYMRQFVIPKDKLDTVFRVAISEARRITKAHIELPPNENFVLEYVTDKVWGGYNYYQGGSQSLIQINTDLPTNISRAIDLASHEGYPGHHVYMTLIEENLLKSKGWMEFSVYPLFSPLSLIAEGSANYGIAVAFPGEQRIKFEKEQLWGLAELDISKADKFYKIQGLMGKLNFAQNETGRAYLNGDITREEAIERIVKYSLTTHDKAEKSLGFIDTYRSYIINYNLGKDMVAEHVELSGGTADQPEKRWSVFKELLSNPYTASSLKKE